MKKLLRFLFIALFFLVSCSSSHSSADSDAIPDSDTNSQDSEIVDDDSDFQDSDLQDSDFIEDSDETSDSDSDADTEEDDWQRDIDIPEMSDDPYFEAYNELDGRIVYEMTVKDTYSWQGSGSYVYDLDTRKVERLGRARMDGWQNKRYYFISTFDYRVETSDKKEKWFAWTKILI